MPKVLPIALRAAVLLAAMLLSAISGAARGDERRPVTESSANELRQRLADWGVQFNITYIGEVLGNISGGVRTGAVYTGRADIGTTIDLERLVGWTGATFHANMYQIHGDGLSRSYVGNLMLVSGVEALSATRLYEMWIEQALFGRRLLIRVGQQPSDAEFIDSKYDDIFVNSALGWPGITGIILPSGGPSPPLAAPGIRLKAQLSDSLTAYLAVFDGDAAPPGPDDPQIKNANGLAFRINDPPWMIGQIRYGFELGNAALPGTIAAGAWYHFGKFDHFHLGADGRSLADPSGTGEPISLRRNQGIFGVLEQKLWHSPIDPAKGLGMFVRTSVSPGDRNLISFYIDGGLQLTGFSASRPDDKIGLAATFARISEGARQFDRDRQIFTSVATPIRDFEAVIEATYWAQLTPNFAVQPVFEYVMHPGGGLVDPRDPSGTRRIRDAIVFGIRTTTTF
ncbi:carbohydrate porin [Rhodopseudomonas sp. HC1]|uniref:carbohydrate porin n=1 Tax=Rhodopseudomonas infernalis TaxID=2897386 RepID=UPI001EE7893B|nr:carbohydrate porin [Rhodopseudomonas infernalis]MCG6203480.1 carbohydrate porin [Rhodopseudomonas infernalis]